MGETDWLDEVIDNISQAATLSDEMFDASYVEKEDDPIERLASVFPKMREFVDLLGEFQDRWFDSRYKGKNAVYCKNEDPVDIKLLNTKKVDFEQMKKVMERKKYCFLFINMLKRMDFSIIEYVASCKQVNFKVGEEKADIVRKMIQLQIDLLKNEYDDLKMQLENVDLFYPNVNLSKTLWIASLSLVFSGLAVLVAVFKP